MKASIYARYSSESQSENSIEDQIRVCKNYIKENGMVVNEEHIFIDEAISGSIINRPGLEALQIGARNKEFNIVVVDDLSRLSRSNHQMLTLVLNFDYQQIKLISVADGLATDDGNSKLGIQIRGFINELYLDDLKKKTMRGLEGQKLRGFSAGEKVFGYYTEPVGELRLNKKGQAKYDGMVHKIDPDGSKIVKRIFDEFVKGKSINKIVRDLNKDKVPTKKGITGVWSRATTSRILKNEKYIGDWVWRKHKTVRDPLNGKKKQILRPEQEHLALHREDLIIIDRELWDKAQKRLDEVKNSYPIRKEKNIKQNSYIYSNPIHLLSGLIKCKCCGGAMVLVSGKGSGYYGCSKTRRGTCENKLLIPRKRLEEYIILYLI